jgi:hypothetical protein
VAPVEGYFGEDADWGAAGGAERDGLFVFGVVGAWATAVKAISKASESIMLRYARAACIWSVVAFARRPRLGLGVLPGRGG